MRRFLLLALPMLLTGWFALHAIAEWLDFPPGKVRQLCYFMLVSGVVTLGLGYGLKRGHLIEKFRSVQWAMLAVVLFGMGLMFVNVLFSAQIMFLHEREVGLIAALMLFAVSVSATVVMFISMVFAQRVGALANAATAVAHGDLHTQVKDHGNDEIAQLCSAFNRMVASLQRAEAEKAALERERRDLLRWISHDLRTPLSAIRAMNDAIVDGVANDPQTVDRYHHNIQREIKHLSHLIDDLFEITQLDTVRVGIEREAVDLGDLISDTLSGFHAKFDQASISLRGGIEPGVDTVHIAPDKIHRVLINLLQNALQHTPPGGTVDLSAKPEGDCIEVTVHNTGSYIHPDHLPHIFRDFYRGDEARRADSDGYRGTGLGLAIAKNFVEAHGGQLHVESNPNRGTTFKFSLPNGMQA